LAKIGKLSNPAKFFVALGLFFGQNLTAHSQAQLRAFHTRPRFVSK